MVAADGAGSALRTRHAGHFGTGIRTGRNRYAWLGTSKVFDAFTFAFVATAHGWIWAYGYAFGPRGSTVVVECAPETWTGLGLDRTDPDRQLALLEEYFAGLLDGHRLTGRAPAEGGTPWTAFRTLTNRTWSLGNLVLLGDAAHTAHYSIGAGTTLALEDAMSLAAALRGPAALPDALARYERERKAALLPVQSAARYSARGTRTCPATSPCRPSGCSPCSASATHPCAYLPPDLYSASTGPPDTWSRCAASNAASAPGWPAPCRPGSRPGAPDRAGG
ncbi:hypothetical protein SFUMM280S_00598 [Streptomyces fumanus]